MEMIASYAADCDCDKCGLYDLYNGPVDDDGGDYTILAVGEAPGENEDIQNKPFIGRSGQLLRNALDELGYPDVTFTNIVRCRPPKNKIAKKHIKCCYRSLPIQDNTRLVLLFGNVPLNAVLGESGITQWNGVVVERDGIVYVPVYHPAYLLRNNAVMDQWLDALDNALNTFDDGANEPADAHYDYHYVYSKPDVIQMCKKLLKSPVIAFDTETADLDAYNVDNMVLAMSFATENEAWAVPIDHPADLAPLDDECIDMICNVLEAHPHVIGHNIKFDQMQCKAMLDCDFEAKGDSMLLSFLVESKKGIHGLKRLAGYYLSMYDYDRDLQNYVKDNPECDPGRGGSYKHIPLDILLSYAGMDASATYQLHKLLLGKLSDKQRILYDELIIPTSNALYHIQCNGISIDYKTVERYHIVYNKARRTALERIRSDTMVIEYVRKRKAGMKGVAKDRFKFNPGSWQQKAVVLYGTPACKWLRTSKSEEWKSYAGKYYGLKPLAFSDSGNPSTKRSWIESYRDECPLVNDLVVYGMISKVLSSYIEPLHTKRDASSYDDRVRSSFNQHVVETGRLSSSSPNLQNIPTPEKEPGTILAYQPIKNMFSHTWPGGCIMSIDYSGMELRVFASLARCDAMLEIHKSGADFHRMVGHMVSGIPVDEITKEQRYRYKWTNWTILFGGSAYTLFRLYGIPLDEGEKVIADYFHRFPEVPMYMRECERFAKKHGYIETPFGNRRPLPGINSDDRGKRKKAVREAVNTPVQGAAGYVTVMAMVIVDVIMRERGFKSMIVNTVHDSIVFDVYPGEEQAVARLCVNVMENIVHYAGHYMPNIDMDWLICPLKADVEAGPRYGAMDHFELDRSGFDDQHSFLES
jgi:DNA polymerase-1